LTALKPKGISSEMGHCKTPLMRCGRNNCLCECLRCSRAKSKEQDLRQQLEEKKLEEEERKLAFEQQRVEMEEQMLLTLQMDRVKKCWLSVEQRIKQTVPFEHFDIAELQFVSNQIAQASKLDNKEIQVQFVSGNVPVGIWKDISCSTNLACQSVKKLELQLHETNHKLEQIAHQLQALLLQQEHLQAVQQDLTAQLAKISPLSKLEVLSGIEKIRQTEETLQVSFQERISRPEWSVDDLLPSDIALALNEFELFPLVSTIAAAKLDGGLIALAVKEKSYLFYGISCSFREAKQLDYAWNLLAGRCFPPKEHQSSCPICSGNRDAVLREFGIRLDLSKHPDISCAQLMFVSSADLMNEFNVPRSELRKTMLLLKDVRLAHKNFMIDYKISH